MFDYEVVIDAIDQYCRLGENTTMEVWNNFYKNLSLL
jgi:hypothetical protein